jgi:hypothetical protein
LDAADAPYGWPPSVNILIARLCPLKTVILIETLATILVATLVGAAIAVPVTYYVTLDRKRVRVLEEQREINRDRVWRETYDSFLNDLRVEQQVSVAQQKILFLTQRELVINERLYYRHIPLSGWIEHRRLLDTELSGEELIKAAQYSSLLTLPGKSASVTTKLVKALLKKAS